MLAYWKHNMKTERRKILDTFLLYLVCKKISYEWDKLEYEDFIQIFFDFLRRRRNMRRQRMLVVFLMQMSLKSPKINKLVVKWIN